MKESATARIASAVKTDGGERRRKQVWTGLAGSSAVYAFAKRLLETGGPSVVVCPREEDAKTFLNDTRFFLRLLSEKPPELIPFPARVADLAPSRLEEPHIAAQRLSALHRLLEAQAPFAIVTSFQALLQRTMPKKTLLRFTGLLLPDSEFDRDDLAAQLAAAGYDHETLAEEKGTFAVRGAILDLFPPNAAAPFRVEFSGDRIESIREFDPATQRSLAPLSEAAWIPCREIILEENTAGQVKPRVKALADSRDLPPSARHGVEDALEERRHLPAMQAMLPLFYDETASIFDYTPSITEWIVIDPFALEREQEQVALDFERVENDIARQRILACPPAMLSMPPAEAAAELSRRATAELSDVALDNGGEDARTFHVTLHSELRAEIIAQRKSDAPVRPLIAHLKEWLDAGLKTVLVAESETGANRLKSLLSPGFPGIAFAGNASPKALEKAGEEPVILTGRLSGGFRLDEDRLAVVAESEIFGERKHTVLPEVSRDDFLSTMAELNPGDAVVHLDHGVGIYRGLERLTLQGIANDFLHLEYAGGDKLYLPVYRLNRIHKYIGADGGKPHVDRLGNQAAWNRTRQKADKAVAEMAQELIQLYAKRKVAKVDAFSRPDESYLSFEADFPYEETRDQARTIEEVSADLQSEKPMDRLICGDVGFGKTEIALRAAFRAAMDGKQVAVLVPTTILAQQHYDNFKSRLARYPVRVDFLSRFKSAQEQKKTVAQLKDGSLDIVVGTHRLLSKDVVFSKLGLLIIDEEHRFGVKHKEQIKKFRSHVHALTLTATPIPRTLQLSMAGIRDLSVINTPPLDRKAIQTFLCKSDDGLVRNVVLKELSRQGQVFFVHNRVETIHAMQIHLKKLLPEAKIEVAHGQMSEQVLEETMHRFSKKEFDVLLCTTIIESGLDIPAANTIIVNRADMFGLAQLYQLRGRVGRADREAYAYLLVPGEEIISKDALKRLKVLKRFTELGSGLKIALHDMEIRGAGNLLGSSQSGHIAAVGFELYTQLLEREVRRLKGENVQEEIEPEIQCALPAYLPDDYLRDTHERLLLYKRFSSAKNAEDLTALRNELIDRFGPVPPTVENLFRVVDMKIVARQAGAAVLRLTSDRPSVEFSDKAPVNLDRLLGLIKRDKRIALRPDNRLVLDLGGDADSFEETKKILLALI